MKYGMCGLGFFIGNFTRHYRQLPAHGGIGPTAMQPPRYTVARMRKYIYDAVTAFVDRGEVTVVPSWISRTVDYRFSPAAQRFGINRAGVDSSMMWDNFATPTACGGCTDTANAVPNVFLPGLFAQDSRIGLDVLKSMQNFGTLRKSDDNDTNLSRSEQLDILYSRSFPCVYATCGCDFATAYVKFIGGVNH